MVQDKLRIMATASKRFIRASNRLVDAQIRLGKHSSGTKMWNRALEACDKADKKYNDVQAALETVIEALD